MIVYEYAVLWAALYSWFIRHCVTSCFGRMNFGLVKWANEKKTVLFLCVVVVVVAAFYSSFIKAISIQAAMSFTSAYAVWQATHTQHRKDDGYNEWQNNVENVNICLASLSLSWLKYFTSQLDERLLSHTLSQLRPLPPQYYTPLTLCVVTKCLNKVLK